METPRAVVVWVDPLEIKAERLIGQFPYYTEGISLKSLIKLVLWTVEQEKKWPTN